jgi:hypothetical protein
MTLFLWEYIFGGTKCSVSLHHGQVDSYSIVLTWFQYMNNYDTASSRVVIHFLVGDFDLNFELNYELEKRQPVGS